MNSFQKYLTDNASLLEQTLTPDQIDMMERYARELLLWNKKINLTAITQTEQVAEKHFLDSCFIAPELQNTQKIMDMGSGGGFPGIIINILFPEKEVVLVDSVRKKVNFLKHVIRMLNLSGIDAIHARVEDLKENQEFNGQFDMIVSRAFADLEKFVSLARPFIIENGSILAMKGKNGLDEITDPINRDYQISTRQYRLPVEQSIRYLIHLKLS